MSTTTIEEQLAVVRPAIGGVRNRRIAVDPRLAHARDAAGDGRQNHRELVSAARQELEEKADELSAKLN